MTLKDYYQALERPVPPKKEFIQRVADKCKVDTYTVRLWINGRSKPSKEEYYQILSEESGIDVNELFGDVQ